MEPINTARGLRKLNCYVPDHIPDRAIIPEDGIEYLYTDQQFIFSPYVVPILTGVRLDMDKFTWEPYRRPTNARLLVSRNKREGRYLGWRKASPHSPKFERDDRSTGHVRVGSADIPGLGIRARKRYWDRLKAIQR